MVFGMVLDYLVSARYSREHDRVIQAKARSLVTLTKYMDEGLELDFADEFMLEFGEQADQPSYFQIWTHDGTVLEKSDSLRQNNLNKPLFDDAATLAAVKVDLPDGRRGRLIGIRFIPQIEDDHYSDEKIAVIADQLRREPVILVVAEEREKLESALLTLHLTLAGFGTLALLLTTVLVRKVIRSGLTPLRELQEQVAQLDTHSLEKRLTSNYSVAELEEITNQFNQLLARLESGFLREKQFSGDVAHELRTPVAEIKALAEVAIRWPDDEAISSRFNSDVLGASIQMETTINNLLALARSESISEADCIDLVDLVFEAELSVKKHNVSSSGMKRHISLDVSGNVTIFSVASFVKLIIDNMIQNAIFHSENDSTIDIRIESSNGKFTISASNLTNVLEEQDLQFIFNRMWRKDKVRLNQDSNAISHAGIGLSLVHNYCNLLGYETLATLSNNVFTLAVSGSNRSIEATE